MTFPPLIKFRNHDIARKKCAANEEKQQQPVKNIKSRFPFPTIMS